ncbi:MAG: HupE/UreJ family protein [Acidobacteria bacterium]|nr:HupE/UreJ family protein [Acidobacteriota bacterium]
MKVLWSGRGPRAIAAAALVLVVAAEARVAAHDIPNDVIVQAFLEPEGERLHMLVRVPLEAMRDMDVPQRDRGYLDLTRVDSALRDAATVWIAREVALYEQDTRLAEPTIVAVRVSLPSDTSFRDYRTAVAHLRGPPLPADTDLYWEQGILDVWLDYAIASDTSRFAMNPGLRPLGQRVTIALRLLTPDGRERAFELHDDPGIVRLDPRWHQAAARFVHSGFEHILSGIDHLLFLLCLVIPLRRVRTLVFVVTSFTVAHSVTLFASAYDMAPGGLWFPPLVETLIATSIVYMALENIVGANLTRRWLITFGFGLVHGFGFSFALRESLQFAGSHLLLSLVSFNVGVELGQLLVLAAVVPALNLFFRFVVAERMGTIILSVIVAHTAWHWMTERGAQLLQFPLPTVDAVTLLWLVRAAMVLVALVAVVWAARMLVRRSGKQMPADHGSEFEKVGGGVRL